MVIHKCVWCFVNYSYKWEVVWVLNIRIGLLNLLIFLDLKRWLSTQSSIKIDWMLFINLSHIWSLAAKLSATPDHFNKVAKSFHYQLRDLAPPYCGWTLRHWSGPTVHIGSPSGLLPVLQTQPWLWAVRTGDPLAAKALFTWLRLQASCEIWNSPHLKTLISVAGRFTAPSMSCPSDRPSPAAGQRMPPLQRLGAQSDHRPRIPRLVPTPASPSVPSVFRSHIPHEPGTPLLNCLTAKKYYRVVPCFAIKESLNGL